MNNFKDNSDKVVKTLKEAQIEALKEISKMLRKKGRAKARRYRKTGRMARNLATWVKKRDTPPKLEFGYKKRGFYGSFFELGTEGHTKDPIIRDTVEESISEIEDITEKWLKKIK